MKKYYRIIFAVYAVIMLWLLFGQRIGKTEFSDYAAELSQNINLVPFETVKLFWKAASRGNGFYWIWQAVRNIIGNVILFIPLGLLPLIYPKLKSFIRYIITVTVAVITVEVLQFFTLLGSCDIDDLILNLIGATVGFYIIKVIGPFAQKKLN